MKRAMSGIGFDPYCLEPKGVPEPVEGPLPPPLALVEDEEPMTRPRWLRWVAVGLLSILGLAVAHHLRALTLGAEPRATAPPAP